MKSSSFYSNKIKIFFWRLIHFNRSLVIVLVLIYLHIVIYTYIHISCRIYIPCSPHEKGYIKNILTFKFEIRILCNPNTFQMHLYSILAVPGTVKKRYEKVKSNFSRLSRVWYGTGTL